MAKATTAIGVKAAKGSAKRREEPDSGKGCVSGLYLVVQPSGAKSWAFRYRFDGKPRKLTLVEAKDFDGTSLADVRAKAREKLAEVEQGRDPAGEKRDAESAKDAASATTVAALVEQYDREHLSTIRSGASVRRYLDRFAVVEWRARDVQSITDQDVRKLLSKATGTPILRNRLHSYLRHWFNWCVDPYGALGASPMVTIKRPQKREESKDRVLSDEEIRWLWKACDKVGEPWGPLARVLLLTGQRLNEVAQMTDAEIGGALWMLPASRAKNGRASHVPLSPEVLAILATKVRVENPPGFIFCTNGRTPIQGFHKGRAALHDALNDFAREAGKPPVPHWTFHDLRRTAATGLARLAVPLRVTEAILNHVSGTGGGIVGVYQRHDYADEKREALSAWGAFVADLVREDATTGGEALTVQEAAE